MVKANPSKAQRRKALIRASRILSNYIIGADSGVAQNMYSQRDFSDMYKAKEMLDRVASRMK